MVSVNSLFRDSELCYIRHQGEHTCEQTVKSEKAAKLWECYEEEKTKFDFVCIILTVTLVTITAVKPLDTL